MKKKLFIEALEDRVAPSILHVIPEPHQELPSDAYEHADFHAAFQPKLTTLAIGEEDGGGFDLELMH